MVWSSTVAGDGVGPFEFDESVDPFEVALDGAGAVLDECRQVAVGLVLVAGGAAPPDRREAARRSASRRRSRSCSRSGGGRWPQNASFRANARSSSAAVVVGEQQLHEERSPSVGDAVGLAGAPTPAGESVRDGAEPGRGEVALERTGGHGATAGRRRGLDDLRSRPTARAGAAPGRASRTTPPRGTEGLAEPLLSS